MLCKKKENSANIKKVGQKFRKRYSSFIFILNKYTNNVHLMNENVQCSDNICKTLPEI